MNTVQMCKVPYLKYDIVLLISNSDVYTVYKNKVKDNVLSLHACTSCTTETDSLYIIKCKT